MPTVTAIAAFDDESDDHINTRSSKHSRVRSLRRATRRDSQARESVRSRRGHQRRLSVRGELRERPDVSKVARAVIQLALAQAEAEAKEQARGLRKDAGDGSDVS